ncbi:hypothetical protein QN382_20555 [Pseudomonas sp. 10B1]|nr:MULTISPECIES: hypothetical protein [unclassified Pseudomonas]MDY7561185.1 hypothetical protein [Pseudomonas sp. AB6]MEA9996004.1 hypothetical protein [Pseudomonas sp. AA4]MEB0089456.1 hypothetical protein [Pseudomonas sp. RTI1]MEB0127805.1 hypothetical protein [Pseudomonas sp. CCC1.2]MEB0154112.1 hypothetical protein [Pseudomonas sp. CCC4.3]
MSRRRHRNDDALFLGNAVGIGYTLLCYPPSIGDVWPMYARRQ